MRTYPTQKEMVLKWLFDHKYITAMDGYTKLYIVDLAGCIRNLKEDGYSIGSEWGHSTNIYGAPVSYKKYYLIKEEKPTGFFDFIKKFK